MATRKYAKVRQAQHTGLVKYQTRHKAVQTDPVGIIPMNKFEKNSTKANHAKDFTKIIPNLNPNSYTPGSTTLLDRLDPFKRYIDTKLIITDSDDLPIQTNGFDEHMKMKIITNYHKNNDLK